jgi:hypothetical protein
MYVPESHFQVLAHQLLLTALNIARLGPGEYRMTGSLGHGLTEDRRIPTFNTSVCAQHVVFRGC